MIPSKIFSAVALLGAIFLSSTAASSLPSRSICYKCPQEVIGRVDGKNVLFDLNPGVSSPGAGPEAVLECL